jgi:hypothetical protein
MKRKLLLIVMSGLFVFFYSCKKYIHKQEEKAAVSIMTNGYWIVSGYKQNDSDITAAFSGYLFKFDANNTVTGTKGSVSVSGQWSDNIVARTITSNFPGAGAPLVYLNETWTITDSYTDSVAAKCSDTVNHTTNILQLKKQ